jgi:hypothetical protein
LVFVWTGNPRVNNQFTILHQLPLWDSTNETITPPSHLYCAVGVEVKWFHIFTTPSADPEMICPLEEKIKAMTGACDSIGTPTTVPVFLSQTHMVWSTDPEATSHWSAEKAMVNIAVRWPSIVAVHPVHVWSALSSTLTQFPLQTKKVWKRRLDCGDKARAEM